MRLLRRSIGVLCGTAGATGLALCVAGLVGCWLLHAELVRRVDRVFGRAEDALADIRGNLGRATDRLRESQAELEAVQSREAAQASQPPAERDARRAVSRKALDALGPQVVEVRKVLVKATEAALVANGLLDALGELPGVERFSVDADRLKDASTQLSEFSERTTKLADLLGRSAPPAEGEVGGESSRAAESLRKAMVLAESGSDRVESGRQRIEEGHARILYWINGVALAITGVLVWIGASQFSLLIHGWKFIRR